MSKRKSTNYVGRLGVRYGRTVRGRLGQIEALMKQKHRCQSCGSMTVKRLSVGLWKCSKCGFTFAGAAYTPTSSLGDTAKRNVGRNI